jgi:hypothetical protein
MTVADEILTVVKRKSGLTEAEIAAFVFGHRLGYQQRVNSTCRRLIDEGKIERQGAGGAADPFTYRVPPIKRRV